MNFYPTDLPLLPRTNDRIKLSVCIPTYNSAKFIQQCLQSILNQSFTDFELIVLDDQSSDRTIEILKACKDPRLVWRINSTRLGAVGNFNACLLASQGEYVTVFHHDDGMKPDNLKQKVQLLDNFRTAGFAYSAVELVDAEGKILNQKAFSLPSGCTNTLTSGRDFFDLLFEGYNFVCAPSVVMRRKCLETIGMFDLHLAYAPDWEMWLRLALFYDVAFTPDILVQYRWHPDNDTHKTQHIAREEQCYLAKLAPLLKFPEQFSDLDLRRKKLATSFISNMLPYFEKRDMPLLSFSAHGIARNASLYRIVKAIFLKMRNWTPTKNL